MLIASIIDMFQPLCRTSAINDMKKQNQSDEPIRKRPSFCAAVDHNNYKEVLGTIRLATFEYCLISTAMVISIITIPTIRAIPPFSAIDPSTVIPNPTHAVLQAITFTPNRFCFTASCVLNAVVSFGVFSKGSLWYHPHSLSCSAT